MRHALALLAALCALPAAAQAPAAPPQREPLPEGRANQKVERIHHEDAHTRIDELRVGGQTRSITVQPKGAMPGYEVRPEPVMPRGPAANSAEQGTPGGQRAWNVLHF